MNATTKRCVGYCQWAQVILKTVRVTVRVTGVGSAHETRRNRRSWSWDWENGVLEPELQREHCPHGQQICGWIEEWPVLPSVSHGRCTCSRFSVIIVRHEFLLRFMPPNFQMARDYLYIPATSVSNDQSLLKIPTHLQQSTNSLKETTITIALLTKVWTRGTGCLRWYPRRSCDGSMTTPEWNNANIVDGYLTCNE